MVSTVTALQFWRDVINDANVDADIGVAQDKYDIINRSVILIAGHLYALIQPYYMTVTHLYSTSSIKQVTGGGKATYNATTSEIQLQNAGIEFTNDDVGSTVICRSSNELYKLFIGTILSVTSTKAVITGFYLPDITLQLDSLDVIGGFRNDTIVLQSIPIMRTGQHIRMEIYAGDGVTVTPVTYRELIHFDGDSVYNRKRIVWALEGNKIYLKYGSEIPSGQMLELHYPRIPYKVTSMNSYVDLPEGSPMELAKIYAIRLLKQRINVTQNNEYDEKLVNMILTNMKNSFGEDAQFEQLKEHIMALK